MQKHQDDQVPASAGVLLSRREVVSGGLVMGLLALAGCNGGGSRAALPNPKWTSIPEAPVCIVPPVPTPQPMPRTGVATSLQIIPRSAWTTAGPRKSGINPMNGIARITVHHDGMAPFGSMSQGDAAARLESIRKSHLDRRAKSGERWADIGYHYIIDPAGRVWEGRSTQYQGAHVQDRNEHNLGILVLGNYEQQSPTPAAMRALDGFIAMQMHRHGVHVSQVRTHKEYASTACPGRTLQAHMLRTRSRGGALAMAAAQMRLA